jgi:hypothetical protein
VIEQHGRKAPGWGLGGYFGRRLMRLLNRSRAGAAGGTVVADCRTQHRIVAGFGTAVAGVAAGSSLLADRVGCHRMAGTGDRGDTAGRAGRWTRCTTEPGCMVTVGSLLAVASGRIPEVREFRGFHTAEAARRTSAAVVAVVAVGSNPGSSRSCCPRQRGLVVGIGSCLRFADVIGLMFRYLGRDDNGLKKGVEMKKIYRTRKYGLGMFVQ